MRQENFKDLQGRKKVCLRLRPNLLFTTHVERQQIRFIVKDPITLRYFHFDETQRYLLEQMDGVNTLEKIRLGYEAKHRPHRMTLEELESFARQLLESNLVYNEGSPYRSELVKKTNQNWLTRLNIFEIKIPLGNPKSWLSHCQFLGNLVFNPVFVVCSCLLFLVVLSLLVTHWYELLDRLPQHNDFFSLNMVFWLWLTMGLVKIMHELSHAFCCKRMGAEVQEIGIVVLFFFPTLYCNVSDSWTLPRKWQRIAVSAAGIYAELIIASLACLLWWFSDTNAVLHHFCFALMVVCSINTILYNANPLMRFDGYYILSDWLEIPNLAQHAKQTFQTMLLRWLGVEIRYETTSNTRLLVWYAIASILYRYYVVLLALYYLYEFMKQNHLSYLGSLLMGLGAVIFLVIPSIKCLRWLQEMGILSRMKTMRVGASLCILAALGIAFFALPLPRSIRGIALVQVMPDQVQRVVIPETEGILQQIHVRDGHRVLAGEILAELINPKLEIKLRLNESDKALRHQQQYNLVAQLTEFGGVKDDRGSEWLQNEHELETLVQVRSVLQEQRERLTLRAPMAGVVLGLPSAEDQGKWFSQGTEFCRVANSDALRAVVLVEPADHTEVHVGATAWIRVHGTGNKLYMGHVMGVAQVEAKNIPSALSSRVAGNVPTQFDTLTQTDQPYSHHYLVSVQFRENDGAVHLGVVGRVKIEVESKTLSWRLRRYLGSTFNWGL